MAQRRIIGSGKRRSLRGIDAPKFDPDTRRNEINLDPKEPALDYKSGIETIRKETSAPTFHKAARPVLCHCGGVEFELVGARWACVNCQPQRPAQRVPAREIVTIPATIAADEAQELRAAWELINSKRAADGLAALPAIAPTAKGYPVDVMFYAELGIEAARRSSRVGGGWRLWQLGKALDYKSGTGHVKRDDLKDYLLSLGVNVRTFERWIIQARKNDFISDIQSAAGEWLVILHNPGKVGASMDSAKLSQRVVIPAEALVGGGWKARVWAAYETIYNGQPVGRGRLQIISDVPRSTQKYREAQAGVKRVRNIAQLDQNADKLPMIRDYARNPFAFYDDGRGGIIQRLPNSYQYTKAQRVNRGRARKVNRIMKSIQSQNGLSITRRALSDDGEYKNDMVRLFNGTPEQTKRTLKKLAKIDNRKVTGIFEQSHKDYSGAQVWRYIPA